MDKTKGRKSNIELLRITAMLMIIMSHLITYGLLTGEVPYTRWRAGSYINRFCSMFFWGGGVIQE